MTLSWTHEGLVRILAERPDLAVALLAVGGHDVAGPLREMGADLTDLHLAELRADLVLTSDGEPRRAVIVEVQLAVDSRKRWSWPAYAATLRLRHRCEVTLVVVATDPKVAAWCAEPFPLIRGVAFAPIVLGPEWIPRVVDRDHASADLELSLLSALAHPEPRVLGATFSALATSEDTERAAVYADILAASIGAARAYWEDMMENRKYEFQSEFARKYVALGREEGREEGLRLAVLRLWKMKFGEPSSEQRARLDAAGAEPLQQWLDRILSADSSEAVFSDA